jgi:hypothetical protein
VHREISAAIADRLAGKVRATLKNKTDAWLRQDRTFDAALADAVTVAADDIVLDDLLTEIRATPDAERLLLGVSVYREPVDVNAVLFQVSDDDPDAEQTPGRRAWERIVTALAGHGLDPAALTAALQAGDLSTLPANLIDAITADLRELRGTPTPPRSTTLDLDTSLDLTGARRHPYLAYSRRRVVDQVEIGNVADVPAGGGQLLVNQLSGPLLSVQLVPGHPQTVRP